MSDPFRIHLVVGTRPEAVKMAPLAQALSRTGTLEPILIATGQHPTMVSQALHEFGLRPDITITLSRTAGTQAELVAQMAPALDDVIRGGSDAVVVQGDTTSALVGGLVAMWRRVPVIHLEAGLRSGSLDAPFPEEANRRLIGVFADLHLAPTERAAAALRAEAAAVGNPSDQILVVGNTVVDAVQTMAARTTANRTSSQDPRLDAVHAQVTSGLSRLLLVTVHRRESWGEPLDHVLTAVRQIVDEHPDLLCVLPAHANPAVRAQVNAAMADEPRIVVTDPLPYSELCGLLARSTLVVTDSGGIQEEAPSFAVPVLVVRDVTERMEAVEAGWAQLVGTDEARIVASAKEILDGVAKTPSCENPFGDGRSADRSAQAIGWLLGSGQRPTPFAAAS